MTATNAACLGALAGMRSLRRLALDCNWGDLRVPPILWEAPGECPLLSLELSCASLRGGVLALGDLANLQSLVCNFVSCTSCELPTAVSRLTSLTRLHLHRTCFPDDGSALHGLTRLRALSLRNNITRFVPGPGWRHLESLDLQANRLEGVPDLSGLTALTSVYLGDQTLGFQVKRPLQFLDDMPLLVKLDLMQGALHPGWSQESLRHLAMAVQMSGGSGQGPLKISF